MKNKRRWIALFTVVFIIFVVVVALWPLGPHAPAVLPEITLSDQDQEVYLRQLQLGWRYEIHRDWQGAQSAYTEAALATQQEIARQARNGLQRVLLQQHGFWQRLQQTLRELASLWLTIILIVGLWLFFTRPIRNPGYLLLPFEDYTEKKIGTGLHALIHFYIQEAHHVHDQGRTQLLGFATSEFPLFATLAETSDEFSEVLSSLDALSVGGVNVPFGKLLGVIRRWLNRRKYIVTGDLQQHGKQIFLQATVRDSDSQKMVISWELFNTIPDPNTAVNALVEELAYRLLFHIGAASQNAFEASSWRSLMLFTQGLRRSQTDTQTDIHEHLELAQGLFQEVTTIDPGFLTARYALGITQTRLGQYEKARTQFDEIIEANRQLVIEATYNLGLTFFHEFRPWAYDMATSCYQTVINTLQNSTLDHPDQSLLSALAYAGIANTTAQMIGEESVLELLPKESLMAEVDKNCYAAMNLVEKRSAHQQTRFVQALICNARGIAAYYADEYPTAKIQLKNALRFQPDNLVAYGYLALVSIKENNETQALEWFDRMLEWHPTPRYIEYFYFKFGRYFHMNADWGRARDYYSQAPNHPYARNYLGEVYAQYGDFDNALAMFRQATQLNRKVPEFWLNLAYYITKMDVDERLSEAVEAANRAVSIRDDWRGRDILGLVHKRQGNLAEAERQLHLSIRHNDQQVQNHYHLADVYWQMGNHKKALEYIEIAFATQDKSPKWRKRAAELRDAIRAQDESENSQTELAHI